VTLQREAASLERQEGRFTLRARSSKPQGAAKPSAQTIKRADAVADHSAPEADMADFDIQPDVPKVANAGWTDF
jgi:hypothetical protein